LEKRFEVKSIGIKYICDTCGEGEMSPTGGLKMFETNATYPHICERCGAEKDLLEKYPLIRYEFVTP
jgi:DNA-directed RNA polymerase subunit RPC12/RpoP